MLNPVDSYSLRARYLPSLLVILPLAAALVPFVPLDSSAMRLLAMCVCSAPAVALLAHLGRDAGRQKQDKLIARWGGLPTTRMLRHRDSSLNETTRARYHAKLAEFVPYIEMPSARKEKASPEDADRAYESCADFLRERTRDKKEFALLLSENVGYGFRRNLWAMKPAAVALAAVSLALASARFAWMQYHSNVWDLISLAGIAVSAVMLTWWLVRITPAWVESAANSYARQLLATCERL